jgi:anti-anti-sigma factor
MQEPEIHVDRVGESVWIVAMTGEHDLATAPQLTEELARIAEHGTDVVVDLSDTTFVDSTIVGVLVRHQDQPRESVAVIAPQGGVPRRVLDLIGARDLIPIFETRAAALEAVGTP